MAEDRKPSPHIEGKYEIAHVKPGVVIHKGSRVDLRTISLAKADKLAAEGFKYLKKVQSSTKKEADGHDKEAKKSTR